MLLTCNVSLVKKRSVFLETESYCLFLAILADILNGPRLKIFKKNYILIKINTLIKKKV